jgi:hypothetical protein
MPHTVVLDEAQLTFHIPSALSAAQVRAIRRQLTSKAFTAAVRRVVNAEIKKHPDLRSFHRGGDGPHPAFRSGPAPP